MPSQMNIPFYKPEPEGDTPSNLYDLVDRFSRGEIIRPAHQRELIWSEDKKVGWIRRLQSDLRPVGVILTYQLVNDNTIWLNDGLQRISTSAEYLANPEQWGDSHEVAKRNLRSVDMPRQHRHYPDHNQALIDFQQVNLGSALTPYEFCRGNLVYMKNYDLYKAGLDKIVSCIEANSRRIISQRSRSKRAVRHKHYRSSYAIFHRYLIKDKSMRRYPDVPAAEVKQGWVDQKNNIEWLLRLEIERISPKIFNKTVQKFTSFIQRETALIETVWFNDLENEKGNSISPTLYRWLLDVAVWKINNNIPVPLHTDFVRALLIFTGGTSYVGVSDEKGTQRYNISLGLSSLTTLKSVCDQIGAPDFFAYSLNHRRSLMEDTMDGYDNSHIKPRSLFGDGETFAEPASLNRARGGREVKTERNS